jgi:hypothetical protein
MRCNNKGCPNDALLPQKGVLLCKFCRIAFLEGYRDGFENGMKRAKGA